MVTVLESFKNRLMSGNATTQKLEQPNAPRIRSLVKLPGRPLALGAEFMKDYLTLWAEGPSDEGSRTLTAPVTVIGEWTHRPKSEFAKVQLTVEPATDFEVVDAVEHKNELERLGVGWPDPVILGLLDTLMNSDLGPLRNVRVTLELVWYHELDSTRNAFRNAGREAGRKIIAALYRDV
jgi:hypothetical protein